MENIKNLYKYEALEATKFLQLAVIIPSRIPLTHPS